MKLKAWVLAISFCTLCTFGAEGVREPLEINEGVDMVSVVFSNGESGEVCILMAMNLPNNLEAFRKIYPTDGDFRKVALAEFNDSIKKVSKTFTSSSAEMNVDQAYLFAVVNNFINKKKFTDARVHSFALNSVKLNKIEDNDGW